MDTTELKSVALAAGADLVGIADLKRLHGIETEPADLFDGFTRAVSLAVRLADPVLDPIVDRPTPLYDKHYQVANAALDALAFQLCRFIAGRGGRSLPLPASQILDAGRMTAALSHKAVAVAAGLGWQGKSLLLVSPQYGPRVRLVTVLTDLPLRPDAPLKNRCGSCDACTKACPVGAIRNVNTQSHYASREEAIRFDRCLARLVDNQTLPHIGGLLCGVCVAACPWGRKKKKEGSGSPPL
jgi:epoxyqueuosine reductase QueG